MKNSAVKPPVVEPAVEPAVEPVVETAVNDPEELQLSLNILELVRHWHASRCHLCTYEE